MNYKRDLPKLARMMLSIVNPLRFSEYLSSKLSANPQTCKRWSLLTLTRYNLASTLILPRLEIKRRL